MSEFKSDKEKMQEISDTAKQVLSKEGINLEEEAVKCISIGESPCLNGTKKIVALRVDNDVTSESQYALVDKIILDIADKYDGELKTYDKGEVITISHDKLARREGSLSLEGADVDKLLSAVKQVQQKQALDGIGVQEKSEGFARIS